ncbi:TraB/GumN family protein [Flavobacterium cyanobacteriorum]|uniref:TraB/GumN family protein n=1 Tax=Flavobacterium cyanobacteriorum TaxID=2022802 RepID=A0A255Z8R4_9FLAO|nr:TraB/GumN family protein [Flavobacterium cyanobacteriorum]OYQ37822.1 TraB/GumN family protein [Flavobacterium cyanobacteriorum]
MKKILTCLISLVAVLAQGQKLENALLWKISGNGLSKPSYLFGTMHITCNATLNKNVLKALDETGQLYLELDMDDPNMQAEMMGGMMMKDGKKMSTLASPEDFKAVDDLLTKNLGMSAKMLDSFMPSLVEMMLMPKMLDCPMQSIEEELIKVSKKQNEEIKGLETVADQMAALTAIPYEEQMKELVKTARDGMAASKAKYATLDKIYQSGNLEAIEAFMKAEENKMYADNSASLLDERNRKWIPVIEKAANEKPTFIGVGAAHLGGENGVIILLRKKGYKVEAVQ